ncbi:MAG: C39 family peptidase [Anaerolineae bacterium]|nr:C39 family peptidase [Anaerolineae bacterium]
MARVVHRLKPWLRLLFPNLLLLTWLAALAASGPMPPTPQTVTLAPHAAPSEDLALSTTMPTEAVEAGQDPTLPAATPTLPYATLTPDAPGQAAVTRLLRGGPLDEGDSVDAAGVARANRLVRRTLLAVPGIGDSDGVVDGTTTVTTTLESAAAAIQAAHLDNVGEVWQTLNNCGPASVSMVLAYYGQAVSQAQAQAALRAPKEWGMLPGAVPPYVQGFDLEARILDHGTDDDLKALLKRGVPVIVAQWLTEQQPIPHYRVVIGYDDTQEEFYINDGVLGFGKAMSYADFDSLWDVYHNLYLPIFRQQDVAEVQGLLGAQWDHTVTLVSIYQSRPAWDALLRAGGPGEPTEEPTEEATPEPTPTPQPNTGPATAWPLTHEEEATGIVDGASAGSFAFYRVKVEASGGHLDFHYTPDDAVIARGVGVRVYSGPGKLVGEAVNVNGRVGERTVALPSTPGVYLVQVFNYLPGVTLEFGLTWR